MEEILRFIQETDENTPMEEEDDPQQEENNSQSNENTSQSAENVPQQEEGQQQRILPKGIIRINPKMKINHDEDDARLMMIQSSKILRSFSQR